MSFFLDVVWCVIHVTLRMGKLRSEFNVPIHDHLGFEDVRPQSLGHTKLKDLQRAVMLLKPVCEKEDMTLLTIFLYTNGNLA